MNVKPIRTEADYERALEMLEPIFDAEPGTPDGDTAEVLTILIDKYEDCLLYTSPSPRDA